MKTLIFPKALVSMARTFADKPKQVGEVLIALVLSETAGKASVAGLNDVQKYVLGDCLDEIREIKARRSVQAAKKREYRKEAK